TTYDNGNRRVRGILRVHRRGKRLQPRDVGGPDYRAVVVEEDGRRGGGGNGALQTLPFRLRPLGAVEVGFFVHVRRIEIPGAAPPGRGGVLRLERGLVVDTRPGRLVDGDLEVCGSRVIDNARGDIRTRREGPARLRGPEC